MKSYTITVNGTAYEVTVEETGSVSAPAAAPKAAPAAAPKAAPAAPTTKICPFCKSEIPIGATKCAHCTSELTEDAGSVINEAAAAGE